MPKATSSNRNNKPRHTPLHVEINKDSDMQKFGRVASAKGKSRAKQGDDEEGAAEEAGVVGGRMSKKILDLARDQQEEVMGEMDGEDDVWEDDEEEGDDDEVERMKKPDEEEEEDLDEGDVSDEEYAELVSLLNWYDAVRY